MSVSFEPCYLYILDENWTKCEIGLLSGVMSLWLKAHSVQILQRRDIVELGKKERKRKELLEYWFRIYIGRMNSRINDGVIFINWMRVWFCKWLKSVLPRVRKLVCLVIFRLHCCTRCWSQLNEALRLESDQQHLCLMIHIIHNWLRLVSLRR